MNPPALFRVTQSFEGEPLTDVGSDVRKLFASFKPNREIKPGQSVAVGVGSRGTYDLKELVAATVECLKGCGLKPHIIPAMGSHGGATAEGQIELLAGLGITEAAMSAPLRASMEVVSLGQIDEGPEVFLAEDALEADHLVVINRIKPHTLFRAEVESGLSKMLAIGLGRQAGASTLHRYDLAQVILPAAEVVRAKVPLLCGLAVTEHASGGTNSVRLAMPDEFPAVDAELLEEAWTLFPRLPIDELDLLIVDEFGKDVSGAGMDPNVIGLWRRDGGPRKPNYKILVLLHLTEPSHGNAMGLGMADLTTQRVVDSIDFKATYMNALTSGVLRSPRIPVHLVHDRAVIEAALNQLPEPETARVGRIVSTAKLQTFWVSSPVAEELKSDSRMTVEDKPLELRYDAENRLSPF